MIKNKTKKTIVSKISSQKDYFDKIQGLIGKKTSETIILKTRFGIHTFLLKFPIDVIILDKNNTVVKLRKNLLPNRVFFWKIRFNTVIELPTGFIGKSKTQIGDVLEFNN
jgi:uncharacterized protein